MPQRKLPCEVRGIVVHGDKRGRLLGFPTANLDNDVISNFAYGVYASETKIEGHGDKTYRSVSSFGIRPTFEGKAPRLETYILDFDEDIYGVKIVVRLKKFIRGEHKFEVLDDLISAIGRDVQIAAAL